MTDTIPWNRALELLDGGALSEAASFVGTVRPDGTPHSARIGAAWYDGHVYFGLNADRDAVPDLDVLAQCLTEALEELVDSASDSRPRAPRGRKRNVIRPEVDAIGPGRERHIQPVINE